MLSAPPVYTHGVLPASPAFQAPAPWSLAPPPGSAGLSSPAWAPFYGTAGHIASELATPSPYRNGDDAGPASSFAAGRQSAMFLTAPRVASAFPYGSFRGEADASRSAVGHQTPLTDNGSSSHAPFGDLHAPGAGPVTPAGDVARSYARRGPVDDEDDNRQQQRATLPAPTAAALPISKRRRSAAATRCSRPTSSHTQRGGGPGAGGAGASAGSPVPGGSFALADGGASHQGRAGVPSGTSAPLLERRAASPCARGRSAGATGATPPTRAGGPSTTAAVVGGTSSAGPATAAQVSDRHCAVDWSRLCRCSPRDHDPTQGAGHDEQSAARCHEEGR